jgi:cholesterol oxidase
MAGMAGRVAISHRIECRERDYDAIVVGSGYGGGVAALRLAEAGFRVCVLERGREYMSGQFPRSTRAGLRQVQASTRKYRVGSRTGLFDFRVGRGIDVLVGCGVGGGSLINAGIALEPEADVFDDAWPRELQGKADMTPWYTTARDTLQVHVGPVRNKFTALELAAGAFGTTANLMPAIIDYDPSHTACTGCGNCVAGCNDGAKRSLDRTYLERAVDRGARVFRETRVLRVSPGGRRRWRVHATSHSERDVVLEADTVILAAGTLGSTEILMRSSLAGLPLSRELGRRFSGNGDYLGLGYDSDTKVDGMGWTDEREAPAGPCISGGFTVTTGGGGTEPELRALVQDGVVPAPFVRLMPAALLASAALLGQGGDMRPAAWMERLGSLVQGPYSGATSRTLTFLLMLNDDHDGVLSMYRDRLSIAWPGASDRPSARRGDAILREASDQIAGRYIAAPWRSLGRQMLTVHPIGGCAMADSAELGVVDAHGHVYAGREGRTVYKGLLVLDGSIIPRALGVNPSLTITALAERSVTALIAEDLPVIPPAAPSPSFDHIWVDTTLAPSLPIFGGPPPEPDPTPAPSHTTAGVAFSEQFNGRIEWLDGEHDKVELTLDLRIEFDDLTTLEHDVVNALEKGNHETDPHIAGRISGRVRLSDPQTSLDVSNGSFKLFVTDWSRVDTLRMEYLFDVGAPEGGAPLRIEGHKVVHDDPGFDSWTDLTTLFVKVWTGKRLLGSGTVSISPLGVANLVTSMTAPGARNPLAGLRARSRYLALFARGVVTTYGKVLATPYEFAQRDETTLVDLSAEEAAQHDDTPTELYWLDGHRWSEDRHGGYASLRLTHFPGDGRRGPVMLAPGFAMRAAAFNLSTTETNLTQYLLKAGYDVWLFDYRAAIDLDSVKSRFTLDDVARQDWPTAVAKVLEVTEASAVDVIGHCMGSTTALMAKARGLEEIRQIVCSQNTLDLYMLPFSRLKARSGLANILQGFGETRISPPSTADRVQDMALDALYRLNPLLEPGERCSSPWCRWVFAYFGPTHCHDRLNEETHRALRDEFGPAGLDAMAHIALMAEKRAAVYADTGTPYLDGEQAYDNLRIPILFLAGERNRIFLPAGARATYQKLRERNPGIRYEFQLLKRYGHLDSMIGRHAHRDVFPYIRRFLDAGPSVPPPSVPGHRVPTRQP